MQTSGTQDMAKLTWLDPAVDLDLFHPLIENAHAATIPAYPDLVTDQLGGDFIEGASHFDITAAMGEQSLRRWLDRFGSTTHATSQAGRHATSEAFSSGLEWSVLGLSSACLAPRIEAIRQSSCLVGSMRKLGYQILA